MYSLTSDPNYIPWIPQYPQYIWYPQYPWYAPAENKNVKRTTKTIEKYNPKGKLISKELIVTEEEVIDIPSYPIITYTNTSVDGTGYSKSPIAFSDDSVSWSCKNALPGEPEFFVEGHSGKSFLHVN